MDNAAYKGGSYTPGIGHQQPYKDEEEVRASDHSTERCFWPTDIGKRHGNAE
ncbi:hypothetical protein [Ramlibacter sp. PS4R-6]|uniref:hypothetical protein n=1 Tax=Ramlibacter sp. PS4R-6 TaxID=3133438 RepID=UPI003094907E